MREHRTHTDDVKLLTLLRKGELYAFEKLFNKYYPLLHAYAKQYVDARVAYRALEWLEIFVKGGNLLAGLYETMLGYPMPKATFLAGVSLHL